jgi:type I restriction enzyme S subunit
MNQRTNIHSVCDIKTGKLNSNAAKLDGRYPFFTCAPEPSRIDTFDFDEDAILVAGNNADGNFHLNRFEGKFNAYQRTYILTAKPGNDLDYIYYGLMLDLKVLRNQSQGSQTKFLTMPILENLELRKLGLKEQKKVVSVLKLIDEKISINTAIAKKMESLAKIHYEYWFRHFNFPDQNGAPYRDSGGKFVWSDELQHEIPKGWSVRKLSDLLQENSEKFSYNDANVDALDLSVMPSGSIVLDNRNSSDEFKTNLYKLKAGDLLFGSIRPYLLKGGISTFDGVVTGTVNSYRVKKPDDYNFCALTLFSDLMFKFAITNSRGGTKMPVIKSERQLEFLLPYNQDIVSKFQSLFSLSEVISSSVEENYRLKILKNWLLPMFMNGQVDFVGTEN